MQAETARWVAVLAAVPFVMVLGNSMLIPVLPTLQRQLGLTPVQTGLVISAFSLPAGLTIPLAGALSDRWGRKAVMVPALVLFGLGGLAAGLAAWLWPEQRWALFAARAVQGVGAGGTYQLAMALAGDIFQSRERSRVLGLLEASNGVGKVVSPLLGAVAAWWVWFSPFFVYGLLALPVAAAVQWLVREPKPAEAGLSVGQYLRQLREVAGQRGGALAACYGAGLVALFSLFGLLSYASDRLEQRWGFGELARGGLLAVPVGLMAACAYVSGLALERRPAWRKPAAVAGMVVMAAGLLAAAVTGRWQGPASLWSLLGAACAVGGGVGVALPALNAAVTAAAARQQRGLVTCLYGTVRFGGVAVGPPLYGLAASDIRRWVIFGASAAACLAAGWALWRAQLPQRRPSSRREASSTSASLAHAAAEQAAEERVWDPGV